MNTYQEDLDHCITDSEGVSNKWDEPGEVTPPSVHEGLCGSYKKSCVFLPRAVEGIKGFTGTRVSYNQMVKFEEIMLFVL